MFELQVITSLARTNWLAPNVGARNDLGFEFHQTLTLAKGRAMPDYITASVRDLLTSWLTVDHS